MKVSITLTKGERVLTDDLITKDPCSHIECGNIECDVCPLRETAEALRKAQNDFYKVLHSIDEE